MFVFFAQNLSLHDCFFLIRVRNYELKYLNIDYTRFDEWASYEEIILTGIEKWLDVENEDEKFRSDNDTKHTIDRHVVTDYKPWDEAEETAEISAETAFVYSMAGLQHKPVVSASSEVT